VAKRGSRKKRSEAAKKGWATRRRNDPILAARFDAELLKKKAARARRRDPETRAIETAAIRSMLTKAGIKVPKRIGKTKLIELMKDVLGQSKMFEAEAQRERQQRMKAEAAFPIVAQRAIQETLTLMHEKRGETEPPEGWVEDDYQIIRTRMSMAAEFGDPSEEAERLADQFEMSPREVFTIWLSP